MVVMRNVCLVFICLSSVSGLLRAESAKLPVPDDAALTEAGKILRELYGPQYEAAKTAASKQALAKELYHVGTKTANDLPGQYAILTTARRVALEAGDLALALQAIDQLDNTFRIDCLSMKAEAIGQLVNDAGAKDTARTAAGAALAVAKEALAAGEVETADRLVHLALVAGRRVRDPQLRRNTETLRDAVAELRHACEAAKAARTTLESKPDDPDANLAAGQFACFVQGDWPRGLPMLALGSDAGLKELAIQELNPPTTAAEQVQLADGWWNLAATEKGLVQRNLLARAGVWYRKALPSESGLARVKIEKRLAEIPSDAGRETSDAANTQPERGSPKVDAEPTLDDSSPVAKGKGAVVCQTLAAKSKPTGLAAEAMPFDGPPGNGRRGANGFLLPSLDKWAAKGTAWSCQYRRDGSSRGIHFVHPFRQGHVVVTFLAGTVHVDSPGSWRPGQPGYVPGSSGLALERSKDFDQALDLSGNVWHTLRSVLLANGRILLYVDDRPVAAGRVPGAVPLELGAGFQGEGFPRRLQPGEAGVIIGPRDMQINEAQSIEFGPAN